jgi:NADH-quinone oxidoreductase subunit G
MTEHVCPVGALTTKDFRFKARVWFLRTANAVCQGCATGCNAHLDYDPRYNKAYRYRPRDNEAVNKYWMCDEGMLTYKEAHDGRVVEASVSGKATTVAKALDEARALFAGVAPASVAIVLGARHSLEDNWALRELGTVLLGTKSVYWSGRADGYHDEILIHRDKNANTKGVQQLAPSAKPLQALVDDVKAGRVTHVIALGADAAVEVGALGAVKLVVVTAHQGPLAEFATVLLPATSWAEHSGTYVNAKGVRQTSDPALQPLGASKPAYKMLAELATALGYEPSWSKLAQIRTHLAGAVAAPAGSSGTNVTVVA